MREALSRLPAERGETGESADESRRSEVSAQARTGAPPSQNGDEFADRDTVELREGLSGGLLDRRRGHRGSVLADEVVSERRKRVRRLPEGSTFLSHNHSPRISG